MVVGLGIWVGVGWGGVGWGEMSGNGCGTGHLGWCGVG